MKNATKFFGIIALIAVIGFSMAACGGEEDDGGDGIQIFKSIDLQEHFSRFSWY